MSFDLLKVYADDMTLTYNWPYGDTVSSVGDINNGYGVYIKLIKYDKDANKKETIVGTPILLYNGALFDNITVVDSSAGTANTGGTYSGTSDVYFCVANSQNDCPKDKYTHFVQKQTDIPYPVAGQSFIEVSGSISGNKGYAIVNAQVMLEI